MWETVATTSLKFSKNRKKKGISCKKAEEIKNAAFEKGEKIKEEAAAANAAKASEIKKNALLKSDEAVSALVKEIISG